MVSQSDYSEIAVKAAKSVMIEIMHTLGDFKEHIVLVGGWVPELIIEDKSKPHVGSFDIDLALDHNAFSDDSYETVRRLLEERGYYQKGNSPIYTFYRDVKIEGKEITIQVDLLAGEYAGTSDRHRHQPVQDIKARKARGCDLVFDKSVRVKIEGNLPEGGKDEVEIKVASILPFLVMKAMALDNRIKEKDAYDIHYCIEQYPGGSESIVSEILPYKENSIVCEALEKIKKHFYTVDHIGPVSVVNFNEIFDPEEREIEQRKVFELVNDFLAKLGMA
jgi:hypothetical protein